MKPQFFFPQTKWHDIFACQIQIYQAFWQVGSIMGRKTENSVRKLSSSIWFAFKWTIPKFFLMILCCFTSLSPWIWPPLSRPFAPNHKDWRRKTLVKMGYFQICNHGFQWLLLKSEIWLALAKRSSQLNGVTASVIFVDCSIRSFLVLAMEVNFNLCHPIEKIGALTGYKRYFNCSCDDFFLYLPPLLYFLQFLSHMFVFFFISWKNIVFQKCIMKLKKWMGFG